MYGIYKRIECLREIDDFLKSTEKFGKKFYLMKKIHGTEQVWMKIIAIGISRDLTYKIRWTPEIKPMSDDVPSPDAVYAADAPVSGWIPKQPQDLERLYPNTRDVPNESGEHHWMTIFEACGFTRVDRIEED